MNSPRLALLALGLAVLAPACEASVEISTGTTKNMSCSAGVCSPTDKKAVLNVNDLTNMLAAGDVKVTTGAGAVTITVMSPFSWTSTSRLTLDAFYNVSFRAPVTVAGTGSVTITYNDGGSGGDLHFFPGAKLDFWDTSSSLVISGTKYALKSTIQQIAAARRNTPLALATDYDAGQDGIYHTSPIQGALQSNFTGLGHTIDNLTIADGGHPYRGRKRTNTYVGLFEEVIYPAVVRDLRLMNASITLSSKHLYVGTIVGQNLGVLKYCFADAKISAPRGFAGGVAGYSYGSLSVISAAVTIQARAAGGIAASTQGMLDDSSATGSIFGSGGGVAGSNEGTIERSFSSVTITGPKQSYVGGLVGVNFGVVRTSNATGNVSGKVAGGIAGQLGYGAIDQSFATGAVSGTEYGGALVGYNWGAAISNSYSVASSSGKGTGVVGGLVGLDTDNQNCVPACPGTIANSYSTAAVSNGVLLGGFIGRDNTVAHGSANVYWDLDTSGISNPHQGAGDPPDDPGITGLTDAQLKARLPEGFDPKVWGHKRGINNGYPYLLANPPPR